MPVSHTVFDIFSVK